MLTPYRNTFERGCYAMLFYIYNTSGEAFVLDIYGPEHTTSYLTEKAEAWAKSPIRAINALDADFMRKLFELAEQRLAKSERNAANGAA